MTISSKSIKRACVSKSQSVITATCYLNYFLMLQIFDNCRKNLFGTIYSNSKLSWIILSPTIELPIRDCYCMIISTCNLSAFEILNFFGCCYIILSASDSKLTTIISSKTVDFTFYSSDNTMILPTANRHYSLSRQSLNKGRWIFIIDISKPELTIIISPARVYFHLIRTRENSVIVGASHSCHKLLRKRINLLRRIYRGLVTMAKLSLYIEAKRKNFSVVYRIY